MPAPAMSSRHLYTGHRRGHIQAAPRLRAHRSEPLSRDHPQIPVSMPSLFRFDASAVVHTCSSSHRTPAPLTARRHPQRSPPRLLTDAACGGLESPPARRPRRTYLHHWHSTDRADDLLHHHHHFPSGHTWVPIIRSWALTRGFALHPGTRAGQRPRQSFRHPQVAVDHHHRHRGMHRRGHRTGILGGEATPARVLQPEVAHLHQHIAALIGGCSQRRVKNLTIVVDVAQKHHLAHGRVRHRGVIVPGALRTELERPEELVVAR